MSSAPSFNHTGGALSDVDGPLCYNNDLLFPEVAPQSVCPKSPPPPRYYDIRPFCRAFSITNPQQKRTSASSRLLVHLPRSRSPLWVWTVEGIRDLVVVYGGEVLGGLFSVGQNGKEWAKLCYRLVRVVYNETVADQDPTFFSTTPEPNMEPMPKIESPPSDPAPYHCYPTPPQQSYPITPQLHHAPSLSTVSNSPPAQSPPLRSLEAVDLLGDAVDPTVPASCLPREAYDELVKAFFTYVEPRIPLRFCHRTVIYDYYRSNTLEPVLLAAMCAHAAPYSTHPCVTSLAVDGAEDGTPFGKWARKLAVRTGESRPTLQTIAGLILLAKYLGAMGEASVQWVYSGMAAHMALLLRLDVEPIHLPNPPPPLERELRRRLWWTAVIMDRAAGAYAGRPLAIRTELTENVRFPCPDDIWDDGTDPCLIQFERAGSPPDPVSPFVHIARLCLILGRVCELSDSSSEDAAHHVPWRVSITDETMRRFDTAIAEYASNLPPVMRFDLPGGPVPSNISSITLVMVTLQHTTARVLLHRPSAMRLLPSTSIHLDIMASSLIVASRALAWLENVTTHRDMRDPDPFASWNVFECGLGCAVVLACPERGDRDQIEEAFQVVTRFLDMAGKRSPVARNMRRQLDEVHRASGRGLLREEYRDDPSKVLEV